MRFNIFKNQKGSALAGALVGAAILGVMAAGMATLISNSQRETQNLTQKFEIMQLQQTLTAVLSNTEFCKKVFEDVPIGAAPTNTTMPKLTDDIADLVVENELLPGSNQLHVTTITFVTDDPVINVSNPGPVAGTLTVNFDQTKLNIARNPVKMTVTLYADPAGTVLTSCSTNPLALEVASEDLIRDIASELGKCPGKQILKGFSEVDGLPICKNMPTQTVDDGPDEPQTGSWRLVGGNTHTCTTNGSGGCGGSGKKGAQAWNGTPTCSPVGKICNVSGTDRFGGGIISKPCTVQYQCL